MARCAASSGSTSRARVGSRNSRVRGINGFWGFAASARPHMAAKNSRRKGSLALSPPNLHSLTPLEIPAEARERLRFLFIAKHALWSGGLHPEDGNHAVYHVEIRTILEELGLNLMLADTFEILFERPEGDFVFPLLNPAASLNSEMLC